MSVKLHTPAQAVRQQGPGSLAHSWQQRTMMSVLAGPGAWAARAVPVQATEMNK